VCGVPSLSRAALSEAIEALCLFVVRELRHRLVVRAVNEHMERPTARHRNIEIPEDHRSDSESLQPESRNADRSLGAQPASREVPKRLSR
jgi:hypothetical protein